MKIYFVEIYTSLNFAMCQLAFRSRGREITSYHVYNVSIQNVGDCRRDGDLQQLKYKMRQAKLTYRVFPSYTKHLFQENLSLQTFINNDV